MSHFVCNLGTTYYPFGESTGKQGLIATMRDVAQRIAPHKARGYVKLTDKIEADCPYTSIPILPPIAPNRSERLREVFEPLASTVLTELVKLQVKAQMVMVALLYVDGLQCWGSYLFQYLNIFCVGPAGFF